MIGFPVVWPFNQSQIFQIFPTRKMMTLITGIDGWIDIFWHTRGDKGDAIATCRHTNAVSPNEEKTYEFTPAGGDSDVQVLCGFGVCLFL